MPEGIRPICRKKRSLSLWAFCRYTLKLSEDDFANLSFAELDALIDEHKRSERIADRRLGQIAQILANANRDPKRNPSPYGLDDFIVYPMPDKQESQEQYAAALKAAFTAWAKSHNEKLAKQTPANG